MNKMGVGRLGAPYIFWIMSKKQHEESKLVPPRKYQRSKGSELNPRSPMAFRSKKLSHWDKYCRLQGLDNAFSSQLSDFLFRSKIHIPIIIICHYISYFKLALDLIFTNGSFPLSFKT